MNEIFEARPRLFPTWNVWTYYLQYSFDMLGFSMGCLFALLETQGLWIIVPLLLFGCYFLALLRLTNQQIHLMRYGKATTGVFSEKRHQNAEQLGDDYWVHVTYKFEDEQKQNHKVTVPLKTGTTMTLSTNAGRTQHNIPESICVFYDETNPDSSMVYYDAKPDSVGGRSTAGYRLESPGKWADDTNLHIWKHIVPLLWFIAVWRLIVFAHGEWFS